MTTIYRIEEQFVRLVCNYVELCSVMEMSLNFNDMENIQLDIVHAV